MRMPEVLASLVDEGIIEEVLRPLMSGKEAQIFLVEAAGKPYVAKVYKEANDRTFKHRADYTEGRKVRNSRDQRAIDKRTKHGRAQDEEAWRSTEVDMIYRLRAAGVRVPAPYQYIDGVLIMELVTNPNGEPAPRLGDVRLTPERAQTIYEQLIRETVRMLCAGVVHGDLSDFNVLLAADGPVIIDFPQSVDPSKNPNARKLLMRDVDNLHRFVARFVPETRRMPYAEEMWALYESSQLTPDTILRGQYRPSQKKADTKAVLELIGEANRDEQRRRDGAGAPQAASHPLRRVEVIVDRSMLSRASARPNRGRSGPVAGRGPAPESRTPTRSPSPSSGRSPAPDFRAPTRSPSPSSGRGPAPDLRAPTRSPSPSSGRGPAPDFRAPTRSPSPSAGRGLPPDSRAAARSPRERGPRDDHPAPQRPNTRPSPLQQASRSTEQRRPGAVAQTPTHPQRHVDERTHRPAPTRPTRPAHDETPRSSSDARHRQTPASSSSARSHERHATSAATDAPAPRRHKP